MKKFRKSPIAIACYVIAALVAVYFIAIMFSTIHSINEYYATYQMKAGLGETLGYLLQNGLGPLTNAIVIFMAGFILDEVRKLNPANWMTEEEIAEAREARQLAREEKQAAKGEAAKIKAGIITEEEAAEAKATESVEAVFVNSDEETEAVPEEAAEEAEEIAEAAEETVEIAEAADEAAEVKEEDAE